MTEHDFKPGTRVAVNSRWSDGDLYEGFVDKLYKSGRFTLRGSAQQWKAYRDNGEPWQAMETGSGRHRRTLRIWTDETDAEIKAHQDRKWAKKMLNVLTARLERVSEPSKEFAFELRLLMERYGIDTGRPE